MIGRAHRFHGYGSLRSVYKYGQTIRGPLFALRVNPNPRRQSYRAAVVVSRKVSPSAVKRNRMRRRLYEALRGFEDRLTPADIIITVFHDTVLQAEPGELKNQLQKQLKDSGVLGSKT